MLDSLEQLHAAMIAKLREKLPSIANVDEYPVIKRKIQIPAVLVELSELTPGDDSGTGTTAFIGRFQARAIVDPNQTKAELVVRELAARVAVAVKHETWGIEVSAAEIVGDITEDSFKPDLDGYLVWLVEWTHQFELGDESWPYPDETGQTIMIGIYPDTGDGKADLYWEAGRAPDAP